MSWSAAIASHRDDDCCMFTTIGRRTGRPHRIEIWFGVDADADAVYLISGNGPTADWFQNAITNPAVSIEFGKDIFDAIASAATDAGERHRIGELMGAKYPWEGDPSIGLTRHAWCFDVPLLRVRSGF